MATNTYTYGSLGQRWTVGETTSKTRLDISRNSADANRWTLQQLLTDPDDTDNFVHGIKAVYTSQESTATNYHNFINYTGASEIPAVAMSTTAGGSTTLNGYLTSTASSNTILWNSRRSTGFYVGSDDKIKFYVSSAFREIPHQGNAIITTSMIDAGTLVIESEGISSNDNDTTIPTSASVKDYVDTATGGAGGAYNDWAVKTGTYTASSKDQLIANSSSAFTITLPSSPSAGNTVVIKNCGSGTVTIGRNSQKIDSLSADGTLFQDNSVQLVYVNSTIGWTSI
tara:strand:- start:334 stop:1185 length:852 start_codon:yes stop_codon:yes gene_type:complete